MFKRNKLSLQALTNDGMESAHKVFENSDLPGIRKSQKFFRKMKNAAQNIAADEEARAAIKKAVVGIAVNVGFSLLVSGRYKLLKSAGVLAVGAIVLTVKKRKERKKLAEQKVDVLNTPVIS